MNIGNTIKNYRKKYGLTQEQVAIAVGVSKPAVSKWESCNAYPDITLLAPLARLFETTVDNLLDYNMFLNEKQINEITVKFENTLTAFGWEKAISYAESQLHQYPNVYGLKISIAQSYFQFAVFTSDVAFQENAIFRSFELLQQVAKCNERDHKEIALNLLANNALLMHRYDEALAAAKQLPQEKVETDILLATIYFHKGNYNECKMLSQKILFRSYKNCDLSLGLLEKIAFNGEDYTTSLALFRKHIGLFQIFSIDSNSSILLEIVEVFAKLNNEEKVIELLNEYSIALESNHICEKYPLFDLLNFELDQDGEIRKKANAQLVEYLSSDKLFLPYQKNKDFKRIVDKIRNYQ